MPHFLEFFSDWLIVNILWYEYQVISLIMKLYSYKHRINLTLFQVMVCVKWLSLKYWNVFDHWKTLPLILEEVTYIFPLSTHLIYMPTLYFLNPSCSKYFNSFSDKRNMFRFLHFSSNDTLENKITNLLGFYGKSESMLN